MFGIVGFPGTFIKPAGMNFDDLIQAGLAIKFLLIGCQLFKPYPETRLVFRRQFMRRHTTDHGIVKKVHLFVPLMGHLPNLGKGMLQDRQLINAFGQIINQSFGQSSGDSIPAQNGRFLNDLLQLLSFQPRNKKLRKSDVLRQSTECGALPDIIRPHGANDIDRQVLLQCDFGGFQDKINYNLRILRRLFVMIIFRVGKKFFKLVNQD